MPELRQILYHLFEVGGLVVVLKGVVPEQHLRTC